MGSPERAESKLLVPRRTAIKLGGGLLVGLLTGSLTPEVFQSNQRAAQAAAVISPFTKALDRVYAEVEGSGIALHSFQETPAAQEEGWEVVGPDSGDLNQGLWFPFAKQAGQKTLHEPGGSLDKLTWVGWRLGLDLNPRSRAEEYAKASLRPGGADWRGHCHATANMQAHDVWLPIGRGESFEYEGETFYFDDVIGLNVAKHATDAEVAKRTETEEIKAVLQAAINKRWTPVVNIPQAGQVWQYAAKRISRNLQLMEVSNFGRKLIVHVSQAGSIYFPGYYDPANPDSAAEFAYSARIGTAGYINKDLSHQLIDAVVINSPFIQ